MSELIRARYDYRPIAAAARGRWPNGAGLAVYVAVGVEHYRFGEGHVEDLLPGVAAPDLVNTSWRDYGNRVGAFRLFDALQSVAIPATVLLNTALYDTAPAVTDAARRNAAEFVGHGVSNSDSLADLPDDLQRDYLRRVRADIERAEGEPAHGWSSPWLTHTPNTIDLLGEAGYKYLLDLRMDDQPVWLRSAGGPLLAIPYALELNDSTTVIGRQSSAAEFADMIIDEFEELRAAAAEQPLVMSIVVHSFISGAPFRLRQLRRALAHIGNAGTDVWLTQPRHIHQAFSRLSPVCL